MSLERGAETEVNVSELKPTATISLGSAFGSPLAPPRSRRPSSASRQRSGRRVPFRFGAFELRPIA